ALVEICSTNEGENYRGKICFALSYDNENFALHVEILEAIDLPPLDCISHSSDPYVRVFLLPDRQEVKITRVKRRTLNPKFNERNRKSPPKNSNEQQMMSKDQSIVSSATCLHGFVVCNQETLLSGSNAIESHILERVKNRFTRLTSMTCLLLCAWKRNNMQIGCFFVLMLSNPEPASRPRIEQKSQELSKLNLNF
uniref:C2 domain-containing protein n=1 Tax=Romanomermis culicivorax TaxID=13658 RepID=A0A915I6J5_ROMCU